MASSVAIKPRKKSLWTRIWQHKFLYIMILPGLLYFLIFRYIPMGGLVIAFQDYNPFLGIAASPFVGFKHFERFFSEPIFLQLLRNTLALFGMNLVFAFPVPILLALMLNEMRGKRLKKSIQTIIYLPHFMSWVIVVSIFYVLFTTEGGAINNIRNAMGLETFAFLTDKGFLRPMYVIQHIWRGSGWGTIIYLAALTAVDEQLYEAAEIDGAGRFRRIWHITLPGIRPTVVTMLILRVGDVLELGFEHMFLLMNALNQEVAYIFDTYVFVTGIRNAQFSYSTAVGLFRSLVGLVLIMIVNSVAKKVGEDGVY